MSHQSRRGAVRFLKLALPGVAIVAIVATALWPATAADAEKKVGRYGQIVDADGKGLAGVQVKAYSTEAESTAGLVGSDVTSENGAFLIDYFDPDTPLLLVLIQGVDRTEVKGFKGGKPPKIPFQ